MRTCSAWAVVDEWAGPSNSKVRRADTGVGPRPRLLRRTAPRIPESARPDAKQVALIVAGVHWDDCLPCCRCGHAPQCKWDEAGICQDCGAEKAEIDKERAVLAGLGAKHG